MVRAGRVGLVQQFGLQLEQLPFLFALEGRHALFAAFAFARRAISPVQILESADLRIEMLVGLHASRELAGSVPKIVARRGQL